LEREETAELGFFAGASFDGNVYPILTFPILLQWELPQ